MSAKYTQINNALEAVLGPNYNINAASYTSAQVREFFRIIEEAHGRALVGAAKASITLTPAGTSTANLVISAIAPGAAGNSITVTVVDNGSDALAVSVSGTDITISLANTTDTNNSLAAIKAALDAAAGIGANTGTSTRTANTAIVHTDIVGTSTPGSAHFVHTTDDKAKTNLSGGLDSINFTPTS